MHYKLNLFYYYYHYYYFYFFSSRLSSQLDLKLGLGNHRQDAKNDWTYTIAEEFYKICLDYCVDYYSPY